MVINCSVYCLELDLLVTIFQSLIPIIPDFRAVQLLLTNFLAQLILKGNIASETSSSVTETYFNFSSSWFSISIGWDTLLSSNFFNWNNSLNQTALDHTFSSLFSSHHKTLQEMYSEFFSLEGGC